MSHMQSPIRAARGPVFASGPVRLRRDLASLRPSLPEIEADGAGGVADALGDAFVIGLGVLPAVANAAIILTALGWGLV